MHWLKVALFDPEVIMLLPKLIDWSSLLFYEENGCLLMMIQLQSSFFDLYYTSPCKWQLFAALVPTIAFHRHIVIPSRPFITPKVAPPQLCSFHAIKIFTIFPIPKPLQTCGEGYPTHTPPLDPPKLPSLNYHNMLLLPLPPFHSSCYSQRMMATHQWH